MQESQSKLYVYVKKIDNIFITRHFFFFILCGGAGTVSNICISCFAALFLHPLLAYCCGYAGSLYVTYFLNAKFNFNAQLSLSKFCKFCLSYIPNFIILFFCVFLLLKLCNFPHFIVYGLAAALGIPITFLLVKINVFSRNLGKERHE